MTTYTVVLRGGAPWGFRLQGGSGTNDPVKVSKINPNSKACNEGVQVGDCLRSVNGQDINHLQLTHIQQIIKDTKEQLQLQFHRGHLSSDGYKNGLDNDTVNNLIDSGTVQSSNDINKMNSTSGQEYSNSVSMKEFINMQNDVPQSDSNIPKYSEPISLSVSPTSPKGYIQHHSIRPAIWSPGNKPVTFSKSEKETVPESSKSEVPFNVKPIWTPGSSPSGARKEFRPVRLNTNVKVVDRTKPKIFPSEKTEEKLAWKPEDSYITKESPKVPPSQVQVQLAGAKLESLLPEAIENAPKTDFNLPHTQSPYITLLQKSREMEKAEDTTQFNIPISHNTGEPVSRSTIRTISINGQPNLEQNKSEQEVESSESVEQKAKLYDGIGPVDNEGLPLAFRKNIDEKNQHAWYRQMYKNLHRTDKQEDENTYEPTYKFPKDISDTRSEEGEVNPYKPAYELPSRITDDPGYRSEPENRSSSFYKYKNKENQRLNAPQKVGSKIEIYKNQPRSIMDYEPGFSSIAFQGSKSPYNPPPSKPDLLSNYSVGDRPQVSHVKTDDTIPDKDSYKKVQSGGEIPIHGLQKPAPAKPKTFKHQTSDVKRLVPMSEKERRRKEEEKLYRRQRLEQLYEEERKRKVIQEEKDLESRRHNDFYIPSMKSPIPVDRFSETNGFNEPSPVSPTPIAAPTVTMATLTVPSERRRGFQIQGKAKALYTFNAQNSRELSFKRGDVLYLLRQIDKNWFEGEKYGRVGIFPVNYVEVLTSIEAAKAAAVQAEGQGRVKYNFTAQSPMELSLRKGEYVTLLRNVDENWIEGRSGNRQGIFPASYVEIINEPSTPLVTPAPSVICTPMTGRGTPEMLSPLGYDAPTPPPQPSPSSFNQPRFPPVQFGFQDYQKSSNLSQRSQSSPLSPLANQPLEQRAFSQKSQLSPGQAKKQVTIKTSAVSPKEDTSKSYGVKSKIPDDDLALSRYQAIYTYRPQNEDELELQEGDEIYVMEKCDDGWYVGTSGRTGHFGTFPGNYVQLI